MGIFRQNTEEIDNKRKDLEREREQRLIQAQEQEEYINPLETYEPELALNNMIDNDDKTGGLQVLGEIKGFDQLSYCKRLIQISVAQVENQIVKYTDLNDLKDLVQNKLNDLKTTKSELWHYFDFLDEEYEHYKKTNLSKYFDNLMEMSSTDIDKSIVKCIQKKVIETARHDKQD